MDKEKSIVALFDLDGVILDTESQYTIFWDDIGKKYLSKSDFGKIIKGQTLVNIFQTYFSDLSKNIEEKNQIQNDITKSMTKFEAEMEMQFILGSKDFVLELKKQQYQTAVVTSSNSIKMSNVYSKIPDFKHMFSKILTAEFFPHGKPAPDCYLLGAKLFNVNVSDCYVFEDSFNGIKAGKSANMKVIGLATTNPMSQIEPLVDYAMSDFTNFSIDKMISI